MEINACAVSCDIWDYFIFFTIDSAGEVRYSRIGDRAVELNTENQRLGLRDPVVIKSTNEISSRCCFAELHPIVLKRVPHVQHA